MLTVKIKFFAALRELVGKNEIEIKVTSNDLKLFEAIRLAGIEQDTVDKLKEEMKKPRNKIILNGSAISYFEAERKTLKDEDEIALLPPVGGG